MFDFANKIISAESGKVHLFSVGQAGFIVKSSNGQLLGIDLYLSDCVEKLEGHIGYKRLLPKILTAEELKFDCIIATHFHRDHFDIDSIRGLTADNKTKLFAARDCACDVTKLKINRESVVLVKPGDQHSCGNFRLTFINCDHGKGVPEAVGVIITVDGVIILETGDTCLRLDRISEYKSAGNVDVLIAPINGAYGNLNEEDCAELSEAIAPKLTIPCHYGMFASHGGNPGSFRDIMDKKQLPYLLMCMGEQYSLPQKKAYNGGQ